MNIKKDLTIWHNMWYNMGRIKEVPMRQFLKSFLISEHERTGTFVVGAGFFLIGIAMAMYVATHPPLWPLLVWVPTALLGTTMMTASAHA